MLISQLISMDKVEIVVRYLHLNLYLMTSLCPPPSEGDFYCCDILQICLASAISSYAEPPIYLLTLGYLLGPAKNWPYIRKYLIS